jgi:hypothetical protein
VRPSWRCARTIAPPILVHSISPACRSWRGSRCSLRNSGLSQTMQQRSHTLSNMQNERGVGERHETSVGRLGIGLRRRAGDDIDLCPAAGLSSWLQPAYMGGRNRAAARMGQLRHKLGMPDIARREKTERHLGGRIARPKSLINGTEWPRCRTRLACATTAVRTCNFPEFGGTQAISVRMRGRQATTRPKAEVRVLIRNRMPALGQGADSRSQPDCRFLFAMRTISCSNSHVIDEMLACSAPNYPAGRPGEPCETRRRERCLRRPLSKGMYHVCRPASRH